MVKGTSAKQLVDSKPARKLNWKKIFPFGTHLRETINDIRIIRSSFKRGSKEGDSPKEAHAR